MIEKINVNDLTYETFLHDFADKKPVIIQGAMDDWECNTWDLNYLASSLGDRKVTIRKSGINNVRDFKQIQLKNYIEHIDNNNDLWYCDWNYPIFGAEDLRSVYKTLDYFSFNTVMKDAAREFRWFFLGSENTGTPLHQDFNHTHAWNGVIFGEKKWVFFSEDDTKHLNNGNMDCFSNEIPTSATPYFISQYAGEIIYAPRNWWHQVVNVKHTFSVSENFWFESELKEPVSK
ncbi:cupin-like domain-containing protein [Paenibacillus sp. NPDC057934]|uniref:cupin-like domain-containing protein n=1 Tax=Paenibacillus sp. NPDC057934 TaxID=3346282 RepID=UPI0036D7F209